MSRECPGPQDEPDYIRNAKPDPDHDRREQAYDLVFEALQGIRTAIESLNWVIRLEIIPDDILSIAQKLCQTEGRLEEVLERRFDDD